MTIEEQKLIKKLSKFSDIHVRNMYWLLFSPSPLQESYFSSFPLFPKNWLNALEVQSDIFFKQLDKNPFVLHTMLKDNNTYRMGIYAEKLMHYFLEYFSDTKLILANYQLKEGKRTIGEIDFIFEWDDRLIHIEMAVKFYLSFEQRDEYDSWIGPSGNDTLGMKLTKVKDHQLSLSSLPIFHQKTNLYSESYLFLKGMFFTNSNYTPRWKNKALDFRTYYTVSAFTKLNQNKQFLLLKKPNWLSALYVKNEEMEVLPSSPDEVYQLLKRLNALHLWDIEKNTSIMIVKT